MYGSYRKIERGVSLFWTTLYVQERDGVSVRKCGFLSAVVNNGLDSSGVFILGHQVSTGRMQQLAYTTNGVPLINEYLLMVTFKKGYDCLIRFEVSYAGPIFHLIRKEKTLITLDTY